MPSAEIITIGTEILLGEIVDTNSSYLARSLRESGIDVYRKTSVGDNVQRIANAIQQALLRCEIIITTGGLGPTVDDPTREAVALAIGREMTYHPELWEQIQARFRRFERVPSENNKRQAYIPQGAIPIENPVGTAPCFLCAVDDKVIISLPGVPREMEHLMQHTVLPYLRKRFPGLGMLKMRIIRTCGAGESQIDDLIGDLETLSNPTVGLAAHSGQVDVRIVAKASTPNEAEILMQPVEAEIIARLNSWIYGVDTDTLESVALHAVQQRNWTMVATECGLGGALISKLAAGCDPLVGLPTFLCGEFSPHPLEPQELKKVVNAIRKSRAAHVGLGMSLFPHAERHEIFIELISPIGEQHLSRPYGGPAKNAPSWAVNHALHLLRNLGK